MSQRFRALMVATVLAMGAASITSASFTSAWAQAPEPQQPPSVVPPPGVTPPIDEPLKPIEPPANLPRPQTGDTKLNLDKLFEALKIAPTAESAKFVENRIWALWVAGGGDTGTLLMGRVKTAMDKKEFDLAIKLLNAIIDFRPEYVEAWNRRATIRFTQKDFVNALTDIREVLKREPRHFGALSGLGMILQEFGDDAGALDAFRRAIAVHPKLEKIPDLVKKLTEKVEGRPI